MSFINYAHRGASEYFPENTLRSFYAGLEMRANGIETDIQCTKDGVLVLYHDDTLQRITGDPRAISDCTYSELLQMDFGCWRGTEYAGERIPMLDTFLLHFGRRGLRLALEIKQHGIEAACIDMVNKYNCRGDITFTSFSWDIVENIRKLDPSFDTGFLTDYITAEILDQLKCAGVRQICPRIDTVTPAEMRLASSVGISVRFWGIRNEQDMYRAIALGGEGMTCNFPDKLTAALHCRTVYAIQKA